MLDKAIDRQSGPETKGASGSCCSRRDTHAEPVAQAGFIVLLMRYQPIFVIVGSALLGSLILPASHHADGAPHALSVFMGLFLFPLALLKLFDVRGFATAFTRYDLAAQLLPGYALLYPFLEMALAIGFLSGLWPTATHLAALIVGSVGTVGIVHVLSKGEKVQCACVGSTLNVPLGSVSIAENAGMAAMALLLLIA